MGGIEGCISAIHAADPNFGKYLNAKSNLNELDDVQWALY